MTIYKVQREKYKLCFLMCVTLAINAKDFQTDLKEGIYRKDNI